MIDLAPFVRRELWIRRTLFTVIAILAIGWGSTYWQTQLFSKITETAQMRAWECVSQAMVKLEVLENGRQEDLRALFGDRQVEP